MPPELIRLNKPRWLVAMSLVFILLGAAAVMGAFAVVKEADYPDADYQTIAFENGEAVSLEADKHVLIEGGGSPEWPWQPYCEVSGDVAGFHDGPMTRFETGSAGEYTVTCIDIGREMELKVSDIAPFQEWINSMGTIEMISSVATFIPIVVLVTLVAALVWYFIKRQKRAEQLRQFEAAGMPPVKQGVGTAVTGLIFLTIGMIIYVGLGVLFSPLHAVTYSILFLILGVVFFVGGGGVKEDQLRRHVEGWRTWYAKQQAAYAAAQAQQMQQAPAPQRDFSRPEAAPPQETQAAAPEQPAPAPGTRSTSEDAPPPNL